MNVFVLDADPVAAAQAQCDKHVVKMPLETAQMLCAVSWANGVPAPYKATHLRHPCTLWAAASLANWRWLGTHGLALCLEYSARYGRTHASEAVLRWAVANGGRPADGELTPWAQAMPTAYQGPDAVAAYRAFYQGDKARFATWRAPATPPAWWNS